MLTQIDALINEFGKSVISLLSDQKCFRSSHFRLKLVPQVLSIKFFKLNIDIWISMMIEITGRLGALRLQET